PDGRDGRATTSASVLAASLTRPAPLRRKKQPIAWMPVLLTVIALAWIALALLVPLAAVFIEAFRKGVAHYLTSIADPEALSAIRLTFTAAAIAVPLNLVFGITAAWAIAKFDFRGKALLITMIDLPF